MMLAFYYILVLVFADSLYFVTPRSQSCKLLIRHIFIQAVFQKICQIFIYIQVISFCHLNHGVSQSTGSCTHLSEQHWKASSCDRSWIDVWQFHLSYWKSCSVRLPDMSSECLSDFWHTSPLSRNGFLYVVSVRQASSKMHQVSFSLFRDGSLFSAQRYDFYSKTCVHT